jgi:hypothetical protein
MSLSDLIAMPMPASEGGRFVRGYGLAGKPVLWVRRVDFARVARTLSGFGLPGFGTSLNGNH